MTVKQRRKNFFFNTELNTTYVATTKRLSNLFRTLMGPTNAIGLLSDMDQSLSDRCFPPSACDASAPYRTMNGVCNNLQFPVWGQSGTSFIRIIQADYADGTAAHKKAK